MTSRRTALKNAAKDIAAANAKRQQRAAKRTSKFDKLIAEFEREAFRNQAHGHTRCADSIRNIVIPKLRELIASRPTYDECMVMLDNIPWEDRTPQQDAEHWAICSYTGTL